MKIRFPLIVTIETPFCSARARQALTKRKVALDKNELSSSLPVSIKDSFSLYLLLWIINQV